jgi:methyltransferase (TIGR00027 family)
MHEQRWSATAEAAAIMRALHQSVDDDPKILVDPIAARLIEPDGDFYKGALARFERLPRPLQARFRSLFVVRSRYAEDCLAASLSHGVRQYVILGAGLDTFAYRQPLWARPLHVFEVDHPASQQWKRRRLAATGIAIPDNVRLVPVDFERVTLTEGLSAAGLDFAGPTFFALLGVSQYLTEASLDLTLRFVRSMPASSEIVLSFVLPESARPPDEAALVAAFAARSAEMGEPWLTAFLPDELVAKLRAMGFSRVAHLSPEAAAGRYVGDRRDGLSVWRNEQMVSATV